MHKLQIIYKKKIKAYLILDTNNNILWQFNLHCKLKENNIHFKLSKKIKKYIFFILNISIFGLSPILNNNEFIKNNVQI